MLKKRLIFGFSAAFLLLLVIYCGKDNIAGNSSQIGNAKGTLVRSDGSGAGRSRPELPGPSDGRPVQPDHHGYDRRVQPVYAGDRWHVRVDGDADGHAER